MLIKLLSSGSERQRFVMYAALLTTVLFGISTLASAQSERRWSASVGGGYTPLVGAISNRLDNGWNARVGAEFNVTKHFSIGPRFSWNGLGVGRAVLSEANVPGGNSHVWSITADPRLRLAPFHHLNPYFVGSVGYYRRVLEFTRPTVQAAFIFDPIFGFFPTFVPADQVLGRITRNSIGGGGGFGFDIGLGHRVSNARFFAEARYEYAATGTIPTRMIPLTFGIRF
ncbi:MAG TPA: outer membrane beta-barrel protein [Terriglobales bacterium]|nr:outer membrane beta-barrel protein [Terriglobales bacterium]